MKSKKTIWVINGPNLNFLGIREKEVYGAKPYQDYVKEIKDFGKSNGLCISVLQTNSESKIVSYFQKAYYKKVDAIVINPAAYTHYSIAIRDAIVASSIQTIEVHISNINEREEFRKNDVMVDVCEKRIMGENCYLEALRYLIQKSN